ncbi:hypothetical protein BV22DRAFT_1037516 [Leucogyrophana mollusca]|uniref:Uncharacterized protein n=1 Tax=Leucogyrophana mollusca TaxID=85980 RepID=A0ACB8BAC0_9AGAM|nr:hypothetical protein BV22DRAFT_1037516 [Leucogyrophana mollusca]
MAKRKQESANDSDSDSEPNPTLIDVDFEFFNPNPTVDYHALKRLLNQLFQTDADAFSTHDLVDLILAQPGVGSTIKTDGIESDPYAFLTVVNVNVHRDHPSVKPLIAYIMEKSASNPTMQVALQGLLGPEGLGSQNHVGLVLCERLINMPVQVVPPMYRMLIDELKWALEDNEPFNFSHLLFVSRVYKLSPEDEEAMQAASHSSKRQKPNSSAQAVSPDGVYPFHPEDEYIQRVASHSVDYAFTNAQPREKDSFGLDTGGRMMLVPANRLQELVNIISEVYKPPGA